MTTDLARVLEQIQGLRRFSAGGVTSPHKLLLLIALARLYERHPSRENRFPLDNELEEEFRRASLEFCGDAEAKTIFIEHPFYHLTTDGIWSLVLRTGMESRFREYENRTQGRRLTRSRLIETTQYGSLTPRFDRCFRDRRAREAAVDCVAALLVKERSTAAGRAANWESDAMSTPEQPSERGPAQPGAVTALPSVNVEQIHLNPFVGYLNSLIRLSAGNESALAEFQALNPSFGLIHVSHPLVEIILLELQRHEGRHVILTGHAGDGKSTIGLDVYRRLMGVPEGQPLWRPLEPREDLPAGCSIIKDLSERHRSRDEALMAEILGGNRKFLIVSNTGALLDFFTRQAGVCGRTATEVESDVLKAVSGGAGEGCLAFGAASFLVLNLALIDNLGLARAVFERMIDPARWSHCEGLPCRATCPVCFNVELINRQREIVLERLFLAYRRMCEYGTRLTLRQITEHLAYLVTSGLSEADIAAMRSKGGRPLKAQFMFFNRFFGDDGKADHAGALRIRAVREVRRQGFGERPCPTWERRLWLKVRDDDFHLGVELCDAEFDLLREIGASAGSHSGRGMTPDQAREQVRRMLYFLYDFHGGPDSFLFHFLNSPMVLRWREWQEDAQALGMNEKSLLEQRIYHVLQEHFTGVRLPEGTRGQDRRLYITLSRSKSDIRQTAQVVVAQVDWSAETCLGLEMRRDIAGGNRTDLELRGRGRIEGANLQLTLPFLDYVMMRHLGEIGETLQPAYVERLERFKARVQDLASESQTHVMLVRLRTDHTFRRQQYSVRAGKLEVSDAL